MGVRKCMGLSTNFAENKYLKPWFMVSGVPFIFSEKLYANFNLKDFNPQKGTVVDSVYSTTILAVGKIGEGTSTVGMLMVFDGDVPLFIIPQHPHQSLQRKFPPRRSVQSSQPLFSVRSLPSTHDLCEKTLVLHISTEESQSKTMGIFNHPILSIQSCPIPNTIASTGKLRLPPIVPRHCATLLLLQKAVAAPAETDAGRRRRL